MGRGPFENGVHGTPVQIGAAVLFVAEVAMRKEALLAPDVIGLIRLHRLAANSVDKQAAGSQGMVADHFRRKTKCRAACQQDVLRIHFFQVFAQERGLLIGGRQHDQAEEVANIPTLVHELHGEPVEQLGVGGEGSLVAEIVGRGNESFAKEQLPVAVDRHTGGEGVVAAEDPLRETKAVGRQIGVKWQDGRRNASLHLLFSLGVHPPVEHKGGPGPVVVHDLHLHSPTEEAGSLPHKIPQAALKLAVSRVELEAKILRNSFRVGFAGGQGGFNRRPACQLGHLQAAQLPVINPDFVKTALQKADFAGKPLVPFACTQGSLVQLEGAVHRQDGSLELVVLDCGVQGFAVEENAHSFGFPAAVVGHKSMNPLAKWHFFLTLNPGLVVGQGMDQAENEDARRVDEKIPAPPQVVFVAGVAENGFDAGGFLRHHPGAC